MDFMSDDFASFCPVMDLSTTSKNQSPSPSNGDVSSEAGDNYHHSIRNRRNRNASPDADDAFTMNETFHLLDAINKHLDELANPKLKKYRIWVRVAEDVNKTCDAKFNGGQCSSRFKNLKAQFTKLQSHFKSSGELKAWPFYNRMLGMFPDDASFNWLNASDLKGDVDEGDNGMDDGQPQTQLEEELEMEDEPETPTPAGRASRARGGHTAGFTTNSAGELVPCFTLRESMTLLDVVRKHIGELKDPRTCKGKIWAKVAAEVNKRCGCGHTGAQCSARYRNLKCRFLKRKQKGTDMTWTFGAKLASVLEAENEVKIEMAAANGSLVSTDERSHQLSSLLGSGKRDDEPMPLKVSSNNRTSFVPTVTAADLRSHRNDSSQPIDLHHTRQTPASIQRRRSRISTGPRRLGQDTKPDLSGSNSQLNLVTHNGRHSVSSPAPPEVSTSNSGGGGGSNSSDCFTASETVTLLDLVAKYLKDLNSPAESGVRRHDIWTRIAAELNDAYGTRYTSTQVSSFGHLSI